jgi:hypothetical protein
MRVTPQPRREPMSPPTSESETDPAHEQRDPGDRGEHGVPVADELVDLLAHAEDLLAAFSILKSEIPRWLRRIRASASFWASPTLSGSALSDAFAGMALSGSGGIAPISAGIAEALITTALGLFVAVPAVWAFNYFNGKVSRRRRAGARRGSGGPSGG